MSTKALLEPPELKRYHNMVEKPNLQTLSLEYNNSFSTGHSHYRKGDVTIGAREILEKIEDVPLG